MAKNDNGLGIIILAVFAGAVFALYFLSKIAFVLGLMLIVGSIFLLVMGHTSQESTFSEIGVILLVVGLIFAGVGHGGITFFEENPTGRSLLDTSNVIADTAKESVKTYNEISQIERKAAQNIINQTS
ncbi:MAG: hypothetical protein KAI26_05275 [Nanoarchaeota archaeon]|nr:hypothetical protein [Nanoarchaeota archaeon]